MKKSYFVVLILLAAYATAASAEEIDPAREGRVRGNPPEIAGFDPEAVTTAARKLLGIKKGGVSLMPMNRRAREEDLAEIIDGLKDLHRDKVPAIVLSRDVAFVADAVGRTVEKYKGVNLDGVRMVVAAPTQPSKEFVELLHSRKIEYFYLQAKPVLKVSEIGLPRGHDSPEGVAVDLALAFIFRDVALLRDTCIPPSFAGGEYGKAYEGFLNAAEVHIKAEAAKSVPSPESPRVIGKLWAVRHFSRNGPTSTGYAFFGFQDVAFVDVGVISHNGTQKIERTLVIKSGDGKWYAHPAPGLGLPLLSEGMMDERSAGIDFTQAYEIQK